MCTILIAEDDKNLRNSLMHFLSDEGYSVLLAENGAKAFTLAKENTPDMIISDINMPIMNGYELLRKLINNPVTSGIPLIYLTGESNAALNIELIEGARALITKPFKFTDLLDQIESIQLTRNSSVKDHKSSINNHK